MIDRILLAPYYYALKFRHWLYDKGLKKSVEASVPTICVGNITVGGTGKTPHTEMLIRILSSHPDFAGKNIAVLSRGYKRKSKGFLEVKADGNAEMYGDEPLQIKKKFPSITVAVDKSRVKGCRILTDPQDNRTARKADIIILDDAFQHRALKPSVSIVLVDYSRPVFNDNLLPIGHLRDLRERIHEADIVIVTKCPPFLDNWEMTKWTDALEIGKTASHKKQSLFFTSIGYDEPEAVWQEGDPRYIHSKRLILMSGIANDKPLQTYLSDSYKIVRHLTFSDHHDFTRGDINSMEKAVKEFPTAIIMTTEKDSQRLKDNQFITKNLKERLFYMPIKPVFISKGMEEQFISALTEYHSGYGQKIHG